MRYIFSVILTLIFFKTANPFQAEKRSTTSKGSAYTLINIYKEFCHIHSLKQLITCCICVTCNTSTLIDHILTNSTEKIFQSGMIDSGISDHQQLFVQEK